MTEFTKMVFIPVEITSETQLSETDACKVGDFIAASGTHSIEDVTQQTKIDITDFIVMPAMVLSALQKTRMGDL